MAKTKNLIVIARGTIAEKARREFALLNRRMPANGRKDWRPF